MRHETAAGVIISHRPTSLATLPPPSEVSLDGRPPWAVVTTTSLVTALGIDRGRWAVWRCRGIGPDELPASWFRTGNGAPLYYRADTVLAWIASRRGERFETLTSWQAWFQVECGVEISDPAELRRQVRLMAQAAGPNPEPGVRFTVPGFARYLDSLLQDSTCQAS